MAHRLPGSLSFDDLYRQIQSLPEGMTGEILEPGVLRTMSRPWIWLVDPSLRLVEVYRSEGGRPALLVTAKDDDALEPPPFDGEIDVGRWWKGPPPSAARPTQQ